MMKQFLFASSLLALGALSTGCASTAQGVKTSAVNSSVPSESLRADIPEGGVLAVIRYPAIVDSAAKDAYHKAYAQRAIGGHALEQLMHGSRPWGPSAYAEPAAVAAQPQP